MKAKIYLLLLLLLLTFKSFSQETKMSIKDYINFSDLPGKTSDMPSWANQLYSNPDQINIKNFKKELNDWLIAEKKEKKEKRYAGYKSKFEEGTSENPLVRFALDFVIKIPNEWINEQGFIAMPTKNTFIKNAENYEKNRIATKINNNSKNILANNWEQIGPMEVVKNDKQIHQISAVFHLDIAPTAPNIRLACSEVYTTFKTIDGGENWTYMADYGGPSAFHPTDPNKIILASNPFRYSSDGGTNWQVLPVSTNCNEIIWSNDGTTIMAATSNGIYVSSDAGANFSMKQAGSFMDVEFKPGSSTIAYAVNSQGVFFKSTDAGLTWIIKSTNYAANTKQNGFSIAVTAANPDLLAIACLTGTDMMVGNKVEIIKSTNNGEDFSALSNLDINVSQGFYAFVFGISPVDVNIYYLGIADFLKSTDGGLTFNAIGGYAGPLGNTFHADIQDMVFIDNKVVIASDGGVCESPDNFTDLSLWKVTSKGLYALNYFGFDIGFNTDQMGGGKVHNGNDMFNPNWNNGKSMYVGGVESPAGKTIFSRPNSMFYVDNEPKFLQIDTDYNPIFTSTYPFNLENNSFQDGMRNGDTTSNTVDSNIIYAGFGNNLLVSYDNGATKQVLKSFNSQALVWDVKTTRKDAKVLYVMTDTDGLWKTVDGGLVWTACNLTINNIDLKPVGLQCYIDVSQTNANEIWLTRADANNATRIFKSTDGGENWTDLNTPTLNGFSSRQIQHQYGSNGGVYLLGTANGISKCYYRNNTMPDWIDYSSNLMLGTALERVFLKASYYKERLIVASAKGGVQTIPFYEKSSPVAQPATNIKNVCVNQEIKFCDYSILNYTGAAWLWSFSKTPIYINGTNAGSRDPIVKFLSPGTVNVTLKVTNSSGQSDTKTITNFVTVNYDSSSCLLLNSDNDSEVNCANSFPNPPAVNTGGQGIITNFNGATTGKFLIKIKLFNRCKSCTADFSAIVNLDTDQISTIRYSHFNDGVLPVSVTGDNTDIVTSFSNRYAQVSFQLINKILYLNHISNFCTTIGEGVKTVAVQDLCWKPTASGVDNGDFAELQNCNNPIAQTAAISNDSGILITDFANTGKGLFYVNINGFTTCNNVTNNLKAIVNLDSDVIHVLEYKHYGSDAIAQVSGNETATVSSISNTNSPITYYLSNNKLYAKRLGDQCGGNSTFRINQSCWSAMDDDKNGIDNALQPSNCTNALSSDVITNADTNLVQDFSSFAATQKGVFVTLNIKTSCNNSNAMVNLNIDLDSNTIHVINYKHFGSTTFSDVLNNDSANVYSESDANGKLKFSLVNDNLYIQRVSTPCADSNYQVTDSCYSLASDQALAINNFISNNEPTIIAYPNPTSNSFTIDTKSSESEFSLNIYDINGKFITSKFEKTNNNLLQVDLTQNVEGIYFVVLFDKSNNKYNYLKIIKK